MLVVLDWDGTLIDSAAKIIRCMQLAIDELALPAKTDAEIREIIGLGLPEAITALFGRLDDSAVEGLRAVYATHFVAADRNPCRFFPGVIDTLSALKADGHQLAIATGKSRRGLDRILQALEMEAFFDASRCADETHSKPHPRMLLELIEQTGVPAEEAVMVGDTAFDMEMARNAGVPRIAVSYGAHPVHRLQSYEPLACIDQFSQLGEWVLQNRLS